MEFKFPVNELFKESIVEINQNMLPPGFSGDRRALWDTVGKISEVVNAMGEASAAAQGLTKPITTAERLRNSEHTIYLLVDQNAGHGRGAVTGMLKTGKKGLYVFDRNGHHYQVSPPCVLDFYVHESRQRNGLGKRLFEHMLQKEEIQPVKMAIDRPSEKFLGFLNKHYNLNTPVKQMNNYVVFDGFFPSIPEKNGAVENNNSGITPGKKLSANGLQSGAFATPMGRYGAPRPHCSMGQIIHNQTSTIQKSTEPTGTRSAPDTQYQRAAGYSPANPADTTQSAPNMYYNSPQQQWDDKQQQSQYLVTKPNTNLGETTRYTLDGCSQQQTLQQPHNNQNYYPHGSGIRDYKQENSHENYQQPMNQATQPVYATGSNQTMQRPATNYQDPNYPYPAEEYLREQPKYVMPQRQSDSQLNGIQAQQPIMETLQNVPERHVAQSPVTSAHVQPEYLGSNLVRTQQFQNVPGELVQHPQQNLTEMYSGQVSQNRIPQQQNLMQEESQVRTQLMETGGQPQVHQPQIGSITKPQNYTEIQPTPQSQPNQEAQIRVSHQYLHNSGEEQLETTKHSQHPSQTRSSVGIQPQQTLHQQHVPQDLLYHQGGPDQIQQPSIGNQMQMQNAVHQPYQHPSSQNLTGPYNSETRASSTTQNLNLAPHGAQNLATYSTTAMPNSQVYSHPSRQDMANGSFSQPNMPVRQSPQTKSQSNVHRPEDARLPGFLPYSDKILSEDRNVKNDPGQSESSVAGYRTGGEENYATPDPRAKGDTHVVEEKISSSPKLERPRSLSIQLSEEQTEENKYNDVERQVPPLEPEKIDDIVEEIAKLAVSENNAVIESDSKSPGKKTPSHLTEQGFFDLKFYHNKLW